MNQALTEKTLEHNQTRMQRREYSRQEKFLPEEKHLLRPLPQTGFEIKYYATLSVGENNCIYLARDKHYYSVPYNYIGEKVQVIYTRTLVRIFCRNTLVATHERKTGFGYSTVAEHLCSSHRFYNNRSPEFYIRQAEKKSVVLAEIVKTIFTGSKPPEVYYRSCDGLLSLQRKSDPVCFEKTCRIELDNSQFAYRFIKSLMEGKSLSMEEEVYKPLPSARDNVRGKQYYK